LLGLTTHFVGDMWRARDLLEVDGSHFGINRQPFLELLPGNRIGSLSGKRREEFRDLFASSRDFSDFRLHGFGGYADFNVVGFDVGRRYRAGAK
jgi:hypothetical protein